MNLDSLHESGASSARNVLSRRVGYVDVMLTSAPLFSVHIFVCKCVVCCSYSGGLENNDLQTGGRSEWGGHELVPREALVSEPDDYAHPAMVSVRLQACGM